MLSILVLTISNAASLRALLIIISATDFVGSTNRLCIGLTVAKYWESKFDNSSDAMDYYYILMKDAGFKEDIAKGNIEVFAMSTTNYTSFYNKRNERGNYPDFFNENYLKKQ